MGAQKSTVSGGCDCGGDLKRRYSVPPVRYEGGQDEWHNGLCNKSEQKKQFDLAVAAGADPEGLTFS